MSGTMQVKRMLTVVAATMGLAGCVAYSTPMPAGMAAASVCTGTQYPDNRCTGNTGGATWAQPYDQSFMAASYPGYNPGNPYTAAGTSPFPPFGQGVGGMGSLGYPPGHPCAMDSRDIWGGAYSGCNTDPLAYSNNPYGAYFPQIYSENHYGHQYGPAYGSGYGPGYGGAYGSYGGGSGWGGSAVLSGPGVPYNGPALGQYQAGGQPPGPGKGASVGVASGTAGDWVAQEGDSLRSLLQDWGDRAGWRVVWNTDREYLLEAGAVFRGDFMDVSSALVRAFARANPAPQGIFYKGNRVLVISTQESENAD